MRVENVRAAVNRALEPSGAVWLTEARNQIAADPAALARLFPAVGRKCGRGQLWTDDPELIGWTVDDAVRALLLVGASIEDVTAVYNYGDAAEKRGVLRALPLLDLGDSAVPLVLDMATSEAAMGKIRMAEKAKQPIPSTWAVTAQGEPTTDPTAAIAGMLLPSGGAKGFGLSFMIDLMCGLLAQGASGPQVQPLYGDFAVPYDCSHLFMAIDVAHFCDVGTFRAQTAMAAERIRAGRRAPGVERLYAPGEPEWTRRERSAGRVTIDAAVADMLARYAAELNVPAPPFTSHSRDKRHA